MVTQGELGSGSSTDSLVPEMRSSERVVKGDIWNDLKWALLGGYIVYFLLVILFINIYMAPRLMLSITDYAIFDALSFIGFTYMGWMVSGAPALEIRITEEGIVATNRSIIIGRRGSTRLLRWSDMNNMIFEGGRGALYPREVYRVVYLTPDQLRAVIQNPRFPLWDKVTPETMKKLGISRATPSPPSAPV